MSEQIERDNPGRDADALRRIANLLGGRQVLKHPLATPLDAHDLLRQGLPAQALDCLRDKLVVLEFTSSVEKALGMSLRTYQRRNKTPAKPLSQEQSGRTWKFAEILTRATAVFGSQRAAEEWLEQPAIGLDQHSPIDLLATPAGVELVEDLLTRLEYGVYV